MFKSSVRPRGGQLQIRGPYSALTGKPGDTDIHSIEETHQVQQTTRSQTQTDRHVRTYVIQGMIFKSSFHINFFSKAAYSSGDMAASSAAAACE